MQGLKNNLPGTMVSGLEPHPLYKAAKLWGWVTGWFD